MKYWIIIHRFTSYLEHNNIIGLPSKKDKRTGEFIKTSEGGLISKYSAAYEIQIGDQLAYYCPAPKKLIIGLFKIIEGPGNYASEWAESIHFRIEPIYPIEEEKSISYSDLVKALDFFKDEDGNFLEGSAASLKLKGTIKEIKEDDFNKIVNLYNKSESSSEIETPLFSKDTLHIDMIKTTYLQATQFQCYSFVGVQERNRVYDSLSEEEEEEVESAFNELPSWLSDIGDQLGASSRLKYIDNIWFFEESPGFYIPFAAYEHEKDGQLRTVMDHFKALDDILKSNKHFKDITPLYFIVAKDKIQMESYEDRTSEHGEWKQFKKDHKFFIFSKDIIENRNSKYIQILTEHLTKIPYYSGA